MRACVRDTVCVCGRGGCPRARAGIPPAYDLHQKDAEARFASGRALLSLSLVGRFHDSTKRSLAVARQLSVVYA